MALAPVDALKQTPGACEISAADIDSWLTAAPGVSAILFAGINKDRPEGNDVAVALREMLRAYPDGLRIGVVREADEMKLKGRFRVIVLPTVVLTVRGEILELLPRVRDWADYAEVFARYLGRPRTVAA
jgi:hydrogenase-1 operon protein HyaE